MCQQAVSRRDFFQRMALGSAAGASILDLAWRRADRDAFGKDLKIITSDTTKKLEAQFSQARLRESLDPHGHPFPTQPHIPVLLEAARRELSAALAPACRHGKRLKDPSHRSS